MPVSQVSGGVLNPCLAVGLWLSGMVSHTQTAVWNLPLYVMSELAGGMLAGLTARAVILSRKSTTAMKVTGEPAGMVSSALPAELRTIRS